MERVHKAVHRSLLGEEKQEMLGLNRRLENYLNRVKLLEEENALLAKEIQSLRHGDQRALTRRKGLEEELQQARLEVDEAWRDKVLTELEVQRLAEELQALNLHRQREAQAHMKAKTMLERSRKDLEEERRAQMWLREKSSQLEHELRLLIQNHQEDVAHLEATLGRSRSTAPPALAQRGNQAPSLLQLGQDYSQRATRAWQEAAEAYQAQLAQLEESLNQTRSRLSQVTQEKSEGHMKLQTLQKEMSSAQDIRRHLEKSGAEQRARHGREIQELQVRLTLVEVMVCVLQN